MDSEVKGIHWRVVQQGLHINTIAVVKLDQRLPRAMAHYAHMAPDVVQLQDGGDNPLDTQAEAISFITTISFVSSWVSDCGVVT